jgi:hypothetical protein
MPIPNAIGLPQAKSAVSVHWQHPPKSHHHHIKGDDMEDVSLLVTHSPLKEILEITDCASAAERMQQITVFTKLSRDRIVQSIGLIQKPLAACVAVMILYHHQSVVSTTRKFMSWER